MNIPADAEAYKMENEIFSDLFGRKRDKQICSSTLQ